jgi:hypothetical protein
VTHNSPGRPARLKRVTAVLHGHFVSEEEVARPRLTLLCLIAERRATSDMRSVAALTDRLEAQMPRMLKEHEAIVKAVGRARTRRVGGTAPGGQPVRRGAQGACAERGGREPGGRIPETEIPCGPVTR